MLKFAAILAMLAVAACGYPTPVVDLRGKDPAQANLDIAYCKSWAANQGFYLGDAVGDCLKKKGYSILAY